MKVKTLEAEQTPDQTAGHLLKQGYAVNDQAKRLAGTFSLDDAYLEMHRHLLWFTEGKAPAIPYIFTQDTLAAEKLKLDQYLVFKKLAIRPDLQKLGIGSQMYQAIEGEARTQAYCGLLVEVNPALEYVYEWFLKLGFQSIATYQAPGSESGSHLLVKHL